MSSLFLFMMPGGQEIILILILVVLLFGGKKIPELMKGVGIGIKSFKEGMNEISQNDKQDNENNKYACKRETIQPFFTLIYY